MTYKGRSLAKAMPLPSQPSPEIQSPYPEFAKIDADHPWKKAVPSGFVEYQARKILGSKIIFFNFSLAKEMGLIPKNQEEKLTKALVDALLDTFSLRIINEYDLIKGKKIPHHLIKEKRYMATRYLQLQHKCKKGTSSGDGRSIWNGIYRSGSGIEWDLSSCGTGVTCLSPGVVERGMLVESGDPEVSYGSGMADADEGLSAAILSESFHARGILTERTLLILETPEKRAINVRAGRNLLRPSHLFLHYKQKNHKALKGAIDLYIQRQKKNGDWPLNIGESNKYDYFLSQIASSYGKFAADLEDHQIFCWLDWDGDNMLMEGGIIDYGSIRQLGLFHHHYRYDDVDRFSTTIKEQKQKAKALVSTFTDALNFLNRKNKSDRAATINTKEIFEKSYQEGKKANLLRRMGLPSSFKINKKELEEVFADLESSLRWIALASSAKGLRKTPDGINIPALFSTRSLLKDYLREFLLKKGKLDFDDLLLLVLTPQATNSEIRLKQKILVKKLNLFQTSYLQFLQIAHPQQSIFKTALACSMRAHLNNRENHATGDGIIYVVESLLEKRKKLSQDQFQQLVEAFIAHQKGTPRRPCSALSKHLEELILVVEENKFSL